MAIPNYSSRVLKESTSDDLVLLDSTFEHPEVVLVSAPNGNFWPYFRIDQAYLQPAR
jgi:hypothetical protein